MGISGRPIVQSYKIADWSLVVYGNEWEKVEVYV